MFEYIFGVDSTVPIDIWLDFGEIIITRLFIPDAFLWEAIVFHVNPYY